MDGTTACAVLGVSPSASKQMIKKAFRTLARRAHPDHSGNAAAFHLLKTAYDAAVAQAESQVVQAPPETVETNEPEYSASPTVEGLETPTPRRRAAWLTGVLTDYPATASYGKFINGKPSSELPTQVRVTSARSVHPKQNASAEAERRHQDFARFLEDALVRSA